MKLLIVESPAKAKTINKYLGQDFKVISSYGHIRGLPSEKGAVDPDNGFAMRYEINDGAEKRVEEIISYVKKSDEIYLATDPDREGEAISWHIIEVLKIRGALKEEATIKRVVFYEITKNSVLDAIKNARSLNDNLVNAQKARQALDYLVGFTLSPVLWRKLPGSRSAGRVQSVALRMIAERESEIEKFKTEEYWTITGIFQPKAKAEFSAQLTVFNNEKLDKLSIKTQKDANHINDLLKQFAYHVSEVNKKQIKRHPNPPFTTATLIQEASRKFGFSAKRTAQIAQKLYEGINIAGEMIGLITYMRTDSVNISQESIAATRNLIKNTYENSYLPKSPRIYKTKSKNAQEAHEAIRPTDVDKLPQNIASYLEPEQLKLYDLIWKRLVASQMESAILDSVSINIQSEDKSISFRATGSTVAFPGFYILYSESHDDKEQEESEKENRLPKLEEKEELKLKESNPLQHFTQPPPRYTEASLVKSMEELGIGRPSTYPSIISILQDRKYVSLEKRRFFTEALGRLVNAFLTAFFAKYVEYNFTANLEDQLDDVASGGQDWKELMQQFWHPFKEKTDTVLGVPNAEVLSHIQKSLEYYIFGDEQGNETRKCPSCSSGTLELKTSKFGSFVGCSNYPNCKYTKKLHAIQEETGQISDAKVLGEDANASQISLKRGPYGFYVQIESSESNNKVKRMPIPQGVDINSVDLKYAKALLELPKSLGIHKELGYEVKVSIGRFGPYVECNKTYASITKKSGIDFLNITLDEAIKLISEKLNKIKDQSSKPRAVKKTAKKRGIKKK